MLMCLAGAPVHADTVVVSADRTIDLVSGRAIEPPRILSSDGRTSAVGTKDTPVPAGVRHVELPGLTLLPGLIDQAPST